MTFKRKERNHAYLDQIVNGILVSAPGMKIDHSLSAEPIWAIRLIENRNTLL